MIGLIGFESIVKSTDHQWMRDASSEHLANEVRTREKWSPLKMNDLDARLMDSIVRKVSGFIQSDHADIRDISIRIIGYLKAE
jgi:hypothetical protein